MKNKRELTLLENLYKIRAKERMQEELKKFLLIRLLNTLKIS